MNGRIAGALMICADHVNAFDEEELDLLAEVAEDLGYALENIERKRAQERVEAELRRLSTAVEQAAEAIVITDTTGAIQYVNPAFERITGYTRSEAIGRNPRILKSGKHGPEFYRQLWETITAGKVWRGCFTNKRKDGTLYEEQATIAPVRDSTGQIVYFIAVKEDVTNQKAAEAALKESQRQLATLISNLPGMVYRRENDAHWTMKFVSEGGQALTGYDPDELVDNRRISYNELILEEDRASVRQAVEAAVATKSLFQVAYRIRTAAGQIKWVLEQGRGVFDEQGNLQALEGYISDITDQKQAEAALAHEVQLRRMLMDGSRDGIVIIDGRGKVFEANRKFAQMLGYTPEEVRQLHVWDWDAQWPQERLLEMIGAVDSSGDHFETRHKRRDGSVFDVEVSTNAVTLGGGKYIFCVCRDITERKQMEEKLRLSEEHFRSIVENTSDIVAELNPDGTIFYLGPSASRILGYDISAAAGKNVLEFIHPEDTERARAALQRTVEEGGTFVVETLRIRHADGSWRTFEAKAKLEAAQRGPRRVIVNARDITERIALEAQLRQMQKLESLGQLAAGVAHDFNNLLAIVQGHAHLLQAEMMCNPSALKSLKQISQAAERGANLTRQLLLFARKQHVQLQTLDLNQVIERLVSMLERLIGEHITLECRYAPEPLLIRADAGMIEQLLINLVVNARDAMPNGGRLRIETQRVDVDAAFTQPHPQASRGPHVRLSVIDTGHGIPPDVLPHIFEPFFTTKQPGKGTGLGLATVYGIVRQHSGWIEVDSQPGKGTAFHVYLPISTQRQPTPGPADSLQICQGNNETVLLVEDEDGVREVSRAVLERAGYRVLEARCGPDAIRVVSAHSGSIDVLVTDVIMPGGINGFELAERLLAQFRHLRIVFTSGYSAAPDTSFLRRKGVRFLNKPYRPDELCRTIFECLHEQF
ncbi:MAG: PAS domain S-box protein [Verrucomicrobiales bacterium]|nr:PAS domain S-box protein [Verrucomicrobiales bacterium]